MNPDTLSIALPDWAGVLEDRTRTIAGDEPRMQFTIELARKNVEAGTGGPFGAAIFDDKSGRLVAIGVNSVLRLESSPMHAEMMAIMRAQKVLGSHTLKHPGHALYSSCDPCAMCLGGILWSGVRRLVCGATGDAARAIGFDEGPVHMDSYRYLEDAGIEVRRGVLSEEAAEVIRLYRKLGGSIYNG